LIQRGQHVRHDFAIRDLTVSAVRELSPSFRRVTLTGTDLAGFTSLGAGDHSKVFFPDPANGDYAVPALTDDGLRMPDAGTVIMRDYTPRAFRELPAELDIDFRLLSARRRRTRIRLGGAGQRGGPSGCRRTTRIPLAPRGCRTGRAAR
jgi:NADPH-dependent ferric siderophore reductase